MARPTARVLTLLELLQSGGIRTKAELADRLEVDERTVRRYVEHLIDLDVPVESVRGRYGGYRLSPGYRLPPLMLTDEEAIAVLLGLTAGDRSGLLTAADTATAKIRRVLPTRLKARLDALLESLAFTGEPREQPKPDSDVLLTIANAVHAHQPVAIRYTDRAGKQTNRVLHPYGLVVHSGRWYVTGSDPAIGEDRTFRLDRIADARSQRGEFTPPPDLDPAQQVIASLARTPHPHDVRLHIQGTADQIRAARLPASVATITGDGPWLQVDLQVEQLDWLPGILATLDLPFAIAYPKELQDRVTALADRLRAGAGLSPPASA